MQLQYTPNRGSDKDEKTLDKIDNLIDKLWTKDAEKAEAERVARIPGGVKIRVPKETGSRTPAASAVKAPTFSSLLF